LHTEAIDSQLTSIYSVRPSADNLPTDNRGKAVFSFRVKSRLPGPLVPLKICNNLSEVTNLCLDDSLTVLLNPCDLNFSSVSDVRCSPGFSLRQGVANSVLVGRVDALMGDSGTDEGDAAGGESEEDESALQAAAL
jgi:hypothetical protein